MSEFLRNICQQAAANPDVYAFRNSRGDSMTYAQLETRSNKLAAYLLHHNPQKYPVALLGHKEPEMLIGMIAAMKAGSAYVPLDASLPKQRVEGILEQLGDVVVLDAAQQIPAVLAATDVDSYPEPTEDDWVSGEDAHYILFTSGSTGTPKGVIQPARSMDCTYRYFSRFLPEGEHLTFFNRAHYSFDLSIFDLAIALPFGHTLFALTEEVEESLADTFAALHEANPSLWVSTPSYLAMCLVDPSFSPELLPNLSVVVVCGETLHNSTAQALLERFPGIALFNTYGPTETQGAITDVLITPELATSKEALPVGTVSPFNELWIVDTQSGERLPVEATGEVVIAGGTVATGYFGRDDLTQEVFGVAKDEAGNEVPYYRTGDEGYVDDAGMLHFLGRLDLQVKVNGYRIELGEIEETLNKTEEVLASCVVPVERNGSNVALAAHVVVSDDIPRDRQTAKLLKEKLKEVLPSYMIPRNFYYHDSLPLNTNGKVDRKALEAFKSSRGGAYANAKQGE